MYGLCKIEKNIIRDYCFDGKPVHLKNFQPDGVLNKDRIWSAI